MVSDFLCECHGSLKLPKQTAETLNLPEKARAIIQPGKNKDGWWKSTDMVKQLRDTAIPIFEALHPGCIGRNSGVQLIVYSDVYLTSSFAGVFCFDQSSNHNAFSSDALVTSRMILNLKPAEKMDWAFRDGWYVVDGMKVAQSLFFTASV